MVGPSAVGPNSVTGGLARRGVEAVKGLAGLAAPPEGPTETAIGLAGGGPIGLALYRTGKGMVGAEQTAAQQAKEQLGKGQYGRAAVTGLSMLDPLAIGPVTNINKLEAEGRPQEAKGAGLFDALSLLVGRKVGKEPTPAKTLNKL